VPPHNPQVSAIVSTYNAERFLRGRLEDLEAQTIAERLEIIVIDSASPGNEAAIVAEFQERYGNIRYLRTDKRETVYQAWNRGIRMATGEFICNANTDDRLRRDCYETLVRALREHPECVLAYPDMRITQEENASFERHRELGFRDWPPYNRLDLLELCCVGPFPLWRRSLHDEIGYFDERYQSAADYEFWLRAAERHSFLHVPEFLGLYWLDEQTVSRSGELPAMEYLQVQKSYRARFAHFAPPPDTLPPDEEERFRALALRCRQVQGPGRESAELIRELEELCSRSPRVPAPHHELAKLYYQTGAAGHAKKYFEKAVLLDPRNQEYADSLSSTFRLELYQSLKCYTTDLLAKPDDLNPLLCAGMLCILLERPEAAREYYLKALELAPDNAPARGNLAALDAAAPRPLAPPLATPPEAIPTPGVSAEELATRNAIDRGRRLARQEQLGQAVELLLQGIQCSPKSCEPYRALAQVLADAGKFRDALEVLEQLPAPPTFEDLVLAGECHQALGGEARARELTDQALTLKPESAAALTLKGRLELDRGARDRAQVLLLAALAADPGHGPACTTLSRLAEEAGDPQQALTLAERGFILAPLHREALQRLHACALAGNALELEAVRLSEALARFPDSRRLAFGAIEVSLCRGEYRQAMEGIENAGGRFGMDDAMIDAALSVRQRVPAEDPLGTGLVSLCLIVKDEVGNLPALLSSVGPLVDEIVVVDTGSQDRSCDLARVYGARVFQFPWTGNFAEARNVSLDQARGRWILVLDADEVLASRDLAPLRALLERTQAPTAFSFTTRNYTDEIARKHWNANRGEYPGEERGSGWTPSDKVRLFPNDPRLRFKGAVHELVEESLLALGIPIHACDVPVHHYGRLDHGRTLAKQETYYRLGLQKLAESGAGAGALLELARQATELGHSLEAQELWLKLLHEEPRCGEAHFNLGYLHLTTGNYPRARMHAELAVRLAPEMKEAAFNLAKCLLVSGELHPALNGSQELLERWPGYPPALSLYCACCFLLELTGEAEATLSLLAGQGYHCADYLTEYAQGLLKGPRSDLAAALFARVARAVDAPRSRHAAC
jgi:glycosyltransferase involved in cell wall biosynthesis/Tfp pilus assembly protein PilF